MGVKIDPELKSDFYLRPKTAVNRRVWAFIGLVDRASFNGERVVFESVCFQKIPLL